MADGIFATIISKDRDLNSSSNCIYMQLADNAGNAVSVTNNKLDVNATVTPENVFVDDSPYTVGTDQVGATGFLVDEVAPDTIDEGDIGIARMTNIRTLLTTIDDGAGNRLTIDSGGNITSNINGTVTVSGTVAATQSGTWDIGTLGTITNAVTIVDGGGSITIDGDVGITGTVAVTQSGTWNVGVTGTVTVSATDLDIRDLTHVSDSVAIGDGTDTLGVNSDGSINVNIVSSAITGEVHDYDTAASVSADGTSNNDYTVSNTMLLKSVIVSGSGNVKFEIQAGPVASLSTVAVGFLTGREGDTKQITFDPAVEVPATSTGTVRIIRTNRQNQAVDVYSTIIGIDA